MPKVEPEGPPEGKDRLAVQGGHTAAAARAEPATLAALALPAAHWERLGQAVPEEPRAQVV
jgi:hypothetical protein